MISGFAKSRKRCSVAFTLLEVLLAIVIASGIFFVAFSFHHQATELRNQLLQESERVSTLRLLFDRMSLDLHCARGDDWQGFTGTSNSIQFVKLDLPMSVSPVALTNEPPSKISDLKVITYELLMNLEGTNSSTIGLHRGEETLNRTTAILTNSLVSLETNSVPAVVQPQTLTDLIRRLQFRFWDGRAWADFWSDLVPPVGVEITLSTEPMDLTETPGSEPEIFRRVVFIPAGEKHENSQNTGFSELAGL
jgi:type II secretory pathway component PulJ